MPQRIDMQYPDFYTQVPNIKLYDPLSEFLGAIEQGEVEISYLDCVKLAGHSCPTVAGAYLMAKEGLKALYTDTLPERGMVKVEMRDNIAQGVTGVVANVISFIIGASDESGFKGIQGKFSRDNLVFFDVEMPTEVKLTRLDTEESVHLSYNPSSIQPDEKMMPLLGKSLKGLASNKEQETFKKLWQERVKKILLSTDTLITIHKD